MTGWIFLLNDGETGVPTTPVPTTLSPTTVVTEVPSTPVPPTTPVPSTVAPTQAPTTPDPGQPPAAPPPARAVRNDIPTAKRVRVARHQLTTAFQIEWDLEWPVGQTIEPDGVRQTVERSRFPNGPFQVVGRNIPGSRTSFVDFTADAATFNKQWFYRVICQRVVRS